MRRFCVRFVALLLIPNLLLGDSKSVFLCQNIVPAARVAWHRYGDSDSALKMRQTAHLRHYNEATHSRFAADLRRHCDLSQKFVRWTGLLTAMAGLAWLGNLPFGKLSTFLFAGLCAGSIYTFKMIDHYLGIALGDLDVLGKPLALEAMTEGSHTEYHWQLNRVANRYVFGQSDHNALKILIFHVSRRQVEGLVRVHFEEWWHRRGITKEFSAKARAIADAEDWLNAVFWMEKNDFRNAVLDLLTGRQKWVPHNFMLWQSS